MAGAEGKGRLALDERLPLRLGLGAAFAGVVGYARAMADGCEVDPVLAVHEYRKAVRRARAVVRLARPLLGPRSFQGLTSELRVALRGTSPLRDAAVLLATLDHLPRSPRTRAARAGLRRALAAEAGATRDVARAALELRRSEAIVRGLPERFVAALSPSVRWRDLEDSLARSYRRVRRARRDARRSHEDGDVHAFRKRVKELRYQLELLDVAAAERPRRAHRALAALAESLGEVTDLTLLRRWVRLRQEELAGRHPEALVALLDREIRARLDLIFAASGRVLRRAPRDFAKRAARRFH